MDSATLLRLKEMRDTMAKVQEVAQMAKPWNEEVNKYLIAASRFQAQINESVLPSANIFKAIAVANATHNINKISASIIDSSQAKIFAKYQLGFEVAFPDPNILKYAKQWQQATELLLVNYNFEDLIDEESPEEKIIVIDESKKVQQIVYDIYRDEQRLFTIPPRAFEELIAELLRHQGFEVELTKQTRDNGYDILALRSFDKHLPVKFLVECKKYRSDRKVGVEVIRSFKEVIETEGANRGMIITSSYFTKPAMDKQKEIPYKLDLRAKDDVMAWVRDYYSLMLNK